LRQVHDKAIVGGFERERIPTRRSSGADRRVDFADNPDLVAVMENLVRDGAARAGAMQDEIVVAYFAGQPSTAESGPHAKRQVRGVTPRSVRGAGRRPGDRRGPGGAGGYAPIRPSRHSDFGDDSLASEEQCLDDRTLARGAACQHVRIAKILRHFGALLPDRNPVRNGPADDCSYYDRTKVATAGASHVTYSPHITYHHRPCSGWLSPRHQCSGTVQSRPWVGRLMPNDAASNLRMHLFDPAINAPARYSLRKTPARARVPCLMARS
jgi:hypothetical protein